jgi:hypothetical protein
MNRPQASGAAASLPQGPVRGPFVAMAALASRGMARRES